MPQTCVLDLLRSQDFPNLFPIRCVLVSIVQEPPAALGLGPGDPGRAWATFGPIGPIAPGTNVGPLAQLGPFELY